MLSKSLKNFLDKNKIKYELIEHRTVYTALDKAATLKVKPAMVGKTVIVSLGAKDYALGLIPANKNLDKQKLLKTINNSPQPPLNLRRGATDSPSFLKRGVGGVKNKRVRFSHLDFATEKWMKANIKGVKLGATPPFGAFYKLPFFIDNALAKQSKIIINAGEYELSLKLSPIALIKLDPNTIKGGFSMAKK